MSQIYFNPPSTTVWSALHGLAFLLVAKICPARGGLVLYGAKSDRRHFAAPVEPLTLVNWREHVI